MNWEALGAIGEIVGAIAVIATLGYLAVQIRHNSRSVEASTRVSVGQARREVSFLTSMNPLGGRFSHRHEPTTEAVFSPP